VIDESDTIAGSQVTIGAEEFDDVPGVTVTTTVTYGSILAWPGAATSATGTDVRVVTESEQEHLGGSGQSLGGTINTRHQVTEDKTLTWQIDRASGTYTSHALDWTTRALAGGTATPDTETTTTHAEATSHEAGTNLFIGVTSPVSMNVDDQFSSADDLTTVESMSGPGPGGGFARTTARGRGRAGPTRPRASSRSRRSTLDLAM
jgi:hypothetical protein